MFKGCNFCAFDFDDIIPLEDLTGAIEFLAKALDLQVPYDPIPQAMHSYMVQITSLAYRDDYQQ